MQLRLRWWQVCGACHLLRRGTGIGFLALVLALVGCGTGLSTVVQPATSVRPTATPVPQVTIQATAQSLGTVAQQNVKLVVAVTVTNHTNLPIALYGTCEYQPIVLYFDGQDVVGGLGCVGLGHDLAPAVAPGTSHTYIWHADLSGRMLQAGTHTLKIVAPLWHQGQDFAVAGTLTTQIPIMLQ